MKVFKFNCGELFYAFSGNTEQEAKEALIEQYDPKMIGSIEEIPESKWDEKFITTYEDNDRTKLQFKVSIREVMYDGEPQLIFTNDNDY